MCLKIAAKNKAKKIGWAILIASIGLGVYYRDLLHYGFMQARGQAHILLSTKPIAEILSDKSTPDSVKNQLRLIAEIKQFAIDSLGLTPSKSYTAFYDQKGQPILWVVTASEKYALRPVSWSFPIIGSFEYKGFFDTTYCNKEINKLKEQGFDTQRNEVSAWSTLGFFKDPVLSSMLERSEGSMANLIIHEMTHGTIFIRDSLEINENLASFVGEYGAMRFLEYKYGSKSKQMELYLFQNRYREAYNNHIAKGATQLDSLYRSFTKNSFDKNSLKTSMIRQIITSSDTLLNYAAKKYRNPKSPLPNNAYFVGFLTYHSKQNLFKNEFITKFNGDLKRYLAYLKIKYKSSF